MRETAKVGSMLSLGSYGELAVGTILLSDCLMTYMMEI